MSDDDSSEEFGVSRNVTHEAGQGRAYTLRDAASKHSDCDDHCNFAFNKIPRALHLETVIRCFISGAAFITLDLS